jgi:hypothetical protein
MADGEDKKPPITRRDLLMLGAAVPLWVQLRRKYGYGSDDETLPEPTDGAPPPVPECVPESGVSQRVRERD